MRLRKGVGAVMVAVAVACPASACQSKEPSPAPPRGGLLVEHVEIVDGDTVAIDAGDGRQRVRIIGIDTPETARAGRPAQCWAQEATGALRALTERASEIRLVEDPTVGDRDAYGRMLRQVLVDGVDVGEQLLAAGHARRYRALPVASPVAARYRLAERQARAAGSGLWGSCPQNE